MRPLTYLLALLLFTISRALASDPFISDPPTPWQAKVEAAHQWQLATDNTLCELKRAGNYRLVVALSDYGDFLSLYRMSIKKPKVIESEKKVLLGERIASDYYDISTVRLSFYELGIAYNHMGAQELIINNEMYIRFGLTAYKVSNLREGKCHKRELEVVSRSGTLGWYDFLSGNQEFKLK